MDIIEKMARRIAAERGHDPDAEVLIGFAQPKIAIRKEVGANDEIVEVEEEVWSQIFNPAWHGHVELAEALHEMATGVDGD